MGTFSEIVLYFILYSVLGWICETVWCSVGGGKLVNRGFLSGPWCPIYGFGAMFVLWLTAPAADEPALIFLIALAVTTTLEYFAGWLLEALFQTRWWDYSNRRFNLKGRVCLRNSIIFGLLGLTVAYVVQPAAGELVNSLQPHAQRVLASMTSALILFDLFRTLVSVTGLRERMEGLKVVFAEMEEKYAWFDRSDTSGSIARLRELYKDAAEKPALLHRLDALGQRLGSGQRVMNAFPQMRPKDLSAEFEALRREWSARLDEGREKSRTRLKSQVEGLKQDAAAAYRGIDLTGMIWVFLIGSIAGYVVETGYCLIKSGYVESRQGMLYGPFSQVYGFGAVVMVLFLAPLAQNKTGRLFFGSAVVGGLFEAACGLVQEFFFGSVSWQYSDQPFSLFGGRTCLLYMLFWGALGTVYIRAMYPRIMNFVGRLPKRPKRFFTWVVAVGMVLNMSVSAVAVYRWSDRISGLPARNGFEEFLDERYPDEMLEEIYPNMEFLLENGAEERLKASPQESA